MSVNDDPMSLFPNEWKVLHFMTVTIYFVFQNKNENNENCTTLWIFKYITVYNDDNNNNNNNNNALYNNCCLVRDERTTLYDVLLCYPH